MSSEDVRSLSSASSFSRLDDNESIPDASLIDRDESTIGTEIDDNKCTQTELVVNGTDSLIDENKRMKLSMQLMKMENLDKSHQKTITDIEALKEKISGEWKIESSTGVEEYLKQLAASELDDVLFQTANRHIEFNGNKLTTYLSVGNKKYYEIEEELSEVTFIDQHAQVTFISDNRLKTIVVGKNEKELCRKDLFAMEDGRLHTVFKASGLECTRVYKKIGDKDEKRDGVIGALKNEIVSLIEENHDLKEKVDGVIEQDSQIEALKNEIESLKNKNNVLEGKVTDIKNTDSNLTNELNNVKQERDDLENKHQTAVDKHQTLRREVLEKFEGGWKNVKDGKIIHLLADKHHLTERKGNNIYKWSLDNMTVTNYCVKTTNTSFVIESGKLTRTFISTVDVYERTENF